MNRTPCSWGLLVVALSVALVAGHPVHAAEPAGGAFARAIDAEDLSALERLVEDVADVDLPGSGGRTALMIASKHGRADLVRRLLRRGADVNVRSRNRGTALMFAALGASPQTLDALLSAGADVNAVGGFDWTALMIASVKGDTPAVKRLLEHGAEVNRADIYGWTPLMRAAFETRHGVVDALLGAPELDLNARNEVGATALHLAAFSGSADIVAALLSHGSAADVLDDEGRTPAEAAAKGGHHALAARLSGAPR